VNHFILDISKVKNELGWTPSVSLNAGIKMIWDWLNKTE
jgi:nucleoside-diphosphate-sugar epimerase